MGQQIGLYPQQTVNQNILIVGGVYFMKERLFKFIDSMGVWDETVSVFLEAVQVIIPSIPGMFLNMLGGYLYGTVVGVIYSTIGTTIGGYIVFLLSRRFGRLFINRFIPKNIIKRLGIFPAIKEWLRYFYFFLFQVFLKITYVTPLVISPR